MCTASYNLFWPCQEWEYTVDIDVLIMFTIIYMHTDGAESNLQEQCRPPQLFSLAYRHGFSFSQRISEWMQTLYKLHFLWISAFFFCRMYPILPIRNQRTQMQAKYPGMGDSVILEYEVLFWVILGKSIRNTHLGSRKWRSRLKISIFTTSQVFLYPLRCSVILIGAEFCPLSRKYNLYLIGDGYTFRGQKCLKF